MGKHSRQVWEDFWDNKEDIHAVYSNNDRIINQVKKLDPVKDKWVMEIGAGSGRDGFKLVDMGARVILLDYAQSSLNVLKKLADEYHKPVVLVQGDAFALPFKTGSFQLVYHQGLLEHFTNPQDILAENYRVISPGGYTLADVPQRYHLYTVVKHILIWMNKWFAGWETEFSIGQLGRLFTGVGFDIHDRYGDWMRPSFFYRALRQALLKVKIRLPLYPGPVPVLSPLGKWFGGLVRKTPLALYTYMDIGVIGKKSGN